MTNKDNYLNALIDNNGLLNEIDLGEKIGLNDDETREIITQLLAEHKIEYLNHRNCSYRLQKTKKVCVRQ